MALSNSSSNNDQYVFDFIENNTTLGIPNSLLNSSLMNNTLTSTASSILYTNTSPSLTTGYYTPMTTAPTLTGGSLTVSGNANITGNITVEGINLVDRLDKIEQRLGILNPNSELEEKWDKLKELGESYRNLEKEIMEKEQIWKSLKS